jgi:hypothetical protein
LLVWLSAPINSYICMILLGMLLDCV